MAQASVQGRQFRSSEARSALTAFPLFIYFYDARAQSVEKAERPRVATISALELEITDDFHVGKGTIGTGRKLGISPATVRTIVLEKQV
jgi:hypothetical protein